MQQHKFIGTYLEFEQYLQHSNIPASKKVIFFVDQPLTEEQQEDKRLLQQTLDETKASYFSGKTVQPTNR